MRQTTRSGTDTALWVLAWGLLAVVVVFSLGPEAEAVEDAGISDKVQHVAAYAATGLAFLLAAVWRPGRGAGSHPGAALTIMAALAALGSGLEASQALRPERTAEYADAIANVVGVVVGAGAWWLLQKERK